MADVLEEGWHVLDVSGLSTEEPKNRYDMKEYIAGLRNVAEDPEKIYQAQNLPQDFRAYPSTWVDLKQNRGETEAGYFNGEIILLGEKHNILTPYNSTLLKIVETMAAEYAGPGRYTLAELAEMVEQKRLKLYDN
jgi:ketopantoate reductase